MGWITGVAIYFVVWWLVLFTVLPFGVRRHDDHGQGHATGAPHKPMILIKMIVTTGIAFLVWLIIYFADKYSLFSIAPN